MTPNPEVFELLALEAQGLLDRGGESQLEAICHQDPAMARMRERFLAIMQAAATDDTTDAPGQSLHLAYQIMRKELDQSNPQVKVSVLRLVYDSLKPAVGLRSTASARRQLMLELDEISVDAFIDHAPTGFVVTLMIEGTEVLSVTLLIDGERLKMNQSRDEWTGTAKPGTARLEIETVERTIVSEPFEIA